jgi:hypothetical protein
VAANVGSMSQSDSQGSVTGDITPPGARTYGQWNPNRKPKEKKAKRINRKSQEQVIQILIEAAREEGEKD